MRPSHLPTRLETLIAGLIVLGFLSYAGLDQLNDQIKTAEVMASMQSQPAHNAQEEHSRQLAQLDQQGRYMTGYDQIATNSAGTQ